MKRGCWKKREKREGGRPVGRAHWRLRVAAGGGEEKGQGDPAPPRGGPSAGRPPYQREQEAPEQDGRGRGQRPLRPHRTAGRPAARRFSAGTGSGSRRGAASTAGTDGRGRRGWAGAAAAAGAATAEPTSSSGPAQRTRKPLRGARGVRDGARRQPGCLSTLSRRGGGRQPAVGPGVSVSSCLTSTLLRVWGDGAAEAPSFFFVGVAVRLFCTPVPTPASRAKNLRALSLKASAHRRVLVTHNIPSPSTVSKTAATSISRPPTFHLSKMLCLHARQCKHCSPRCKSDVTPHYT